MVHSEMGTGGPSGATLTINEGIKALSPSAVVMVGIAFGVDRKKQCIGDILVSRQLLAYELQRVGKAGTEVNIIVRGDRPQASPRILDRFRAGALNWSGQKVDFGLVLSGDKLVDNIDFRDQLCRFAPDAIGGEMEGTGLYSAAQRNKVDWILVKAICDWADGNKGRNKSVRQQQAAENAVHFALHVLQQGGISQHAMSSSIPPTETPKTQTLCTYNIHANWGVVVAWEPDGNRIASAGGDGIVQVWDADNEQPLLTYRGHNRRLAGVGLPPPAIYTIAWSPEGLRIASAGDGTQVYVWDATTGHNLATYQGHTGISPGVYALSWSPDGTRIASACSTTIGTDKTVHIWEVATGQTLLHCDASNSLLPNFSAFAVAWSPDGTRIAATCGDKTIRVWHAVNGHLISAYQSNAKYESRIAWSPDSTRIAAIVSSNHTVEVWDTKTAANILTYFGHTNRVRGIAWSPDGSRIASASNDKTVQIWDSATGTLISRYVGHSDRATSVAWSPDGMRIASASNDRTVQIWQANQGI